MFKDVPDVGGQPDYTGFTIPETDKYRINKAIIGVDGSEQFNDKA